MDNKLRLITDEELDKPRMETESGLISVPVEQICINPIQPRRKVDEDRLNELAESLRQNGLLQPLILTKIDGLYHLVIGERRLRAVKKLGWSEVPAIVKEHTWEEMLSIALVENLQREDLNPLEEARAYQLLMSQYEYTQEKVAEKVARSRPHIANMLRLLNLPEYVLSALESGEISAGHARALLGLEDRRKIHRLLAKIVKKGLSVRQTEDMVRLINAPPEEKKRKNTPEEFRDVQEKLTERLSARVNIKKARRGKGKIEIFFDSVDDFNRIIEIMGEREEW